MIVLYEPYEREGRAFGKIAILVGIVAAAYMFMVTVGLLLMALEPALIPFYVLAGFLADVSKGTQLDLGFLVLLANIGIPISFWRTGRHEYVHWLRSLGILDRRRYVWYLVCSAPFQLYVGAYLWMQFEGGYDADGPIGFGFGGDWQTDSIFAPRMFHYLWDNLNIHMAGTAAAFVVAKALFVKALWAQEDGRPAEYVVVSDDQGGDVIVARPA